MNGFVRLRRELLKTQIDNFWYLLVTGSSFSKLSHGQFVYLEGFKTINAHLGPKIDFWMLAVPRY